MFRKFVPSWLLQREGSSRRKKSCSRPSGDSGDHNSNSSSGKHAPVLTYPTIQQPALSEEPELELLQLSADQKEKLKTSWQIIYSKMGHTLCYVGDSGGGAGGAGGEGGGGVAETFLRLFQEYPRSQEFFIRFKGTPVEDLRQDVRLSKELEAHAVRVMQVVEKVIARIDNMDKSTEYLLNLGKFHRLSGIPNDYFGVMGTIFLHAVRPYLQEGDCWDAVTEDVWLELFGHIARVMTHGHKYFHLSAATRQGSSKLPEGRGSKGKR